MSHAWVVVAAHTQPLAVAIVNDPDPPDPATVALAGVRTYEHVFAAWVTVKGFPATVNVAVRWTVSVLGATVNVTVPVPLPLALPVIVIHVNVLVVVHEQPAAVVTVVDPFAPPATTDCDVGESENVQPVGSCVTVNVRPAIVAVAVRCKVVVLGGALKVTVPLPFPLAPLVSVSHPVLLTAVHVQPAAVVTAVEGAPPLEPTFCDTGEIV